MAGALPSGGDSDYFALGDGGVVGAAMAALTGRSQANVQDFYKAQMQGSTPWTTASNDFFQSLDAALGFPTAFLKALAESLLNVVLPGVGTVGDVLDALVSWVEDLSNQVVMWVRDNVGIDLSSWDAFLASLKDGKGIDLPIVPDLLDWLGRAINDVLILLDVFHLTHSAAAWNAAWADLMTLFGLTQSTATPTYAPPTIGPSITSVVNSLVNGFTGLFGSWNPGDEADPIVDAATNIAALNAAIAALQQAGNAGQSVSLDFASFADSTNMPSVFTQTYGPGTVTYGITNGRACRGTGNGSRATSYLYNVWVTDTDEQLVAGVWSAQPSTDGLGNRGEVRLEGRKDSTDTTKVYAALTADSAQLGCYVAGVKTVFKTVGAGGTGTFRFKAGALYVLYCGQTAGTRVFVLTENGTPMLTFTDSAGGGVSQVGASYRGGGGAASWPANLGNIGPGRMMYFALADN